MKSQVRHVLVLMASGLSAGHLPAAEVEPCSLLKLEEVGAVLQGPATMGQPHRVRLNGVTVGGDCFYRSELDRTTVVTLTVDAYPAGHQRATFDRGRQRPHVLDVPNLGDIAYAHAPPNGLQSVTFLRKQTLVTISVVGVGLPEAKELAALAAARLP